ncbi:MAG TPA: SDR family oxidoreductase [Steroidobacter sp.]|jgi:NAD(P)-dependent dehydrogenase (short-subunit alcohol dehydrogenase family)|nr:SDR family oxidoreductase [Steroidobacteraceae bacterium]HLS82583.1 SDR family oxidoreductase [Steroidobacter sp.]
MFDLSGQVAVITGSSRGIGRAIAHAMARAGARVVVSSRKPEACERVVEEIRREGGEAIATTCNVAEKTQLQALVDSALNAWGRLNIVVCNAAVNPYFGPMSGMKDEAYDKIMNSNVRSNFWLCNMAGPHMVASGGGGFIIVSSIGGNQGSATLGVYGMSKAADYALTRNLAVEWGPQGLRANCIAPGLIKTDFSRALWENEKLLAGVEQGTPVRRIGQPEDLGGVAVFLASRAAAYITGQTLVVDGGVTIKEPA